MLHTKLEKKGDKSGTLFATWHFSGEERSRRLWPVIFETTLQKVNGLDVTCVLRRWILTIIGYVLSAEMVKKASTQ